MKLAKYKALVQSFYDIWQPKFEQMDFLLEILKITIPGLIVFATSYFVLKQVLEGQLKRRELDLRRVEKQSFTPNKVNAYERLTLFLERIHLADMVLRVHQKGMKGRTFQQELVKTIRTEYQHNLTQQLYVSNTAWHLIKSAKEETIKMVNVSAAKMPDEASGIDLSNMIFKLLSQIEKNPVDLAKEYLKQELRKTI